jgi:SSS family solute:Na+ symporter
VIWTDVILILCFMLGAFVALGTIVSHLDGGLGEMFRVGWQAGTGDHWYDWGKFTFFDFSISPIRQYTIWTAAIASTWGGLGAYGTDQLLAQRMFCCKNERDARWAIISSSASQIVTITVMFVGAGLYAYYQAHPLTGEALNLSQEKGDRIFPIFIVQVIPRGLKGLIIAGIFAAAISSLMGILTALSQTVMSAFYNPLRERHLRRRGVTVPLTSNIEDLAEKGEPTAEDRRSVLVGRLFVIFWGIVLSLMAYLAEYVSQYYKSILDLGLSMAGYVTGALLAGFFLSFLRLRIDGRGFMYSGPLSVLCVFALIWHQPWTNWVCWAAAGVILLIWILMTRRARARAAPPLLPVSVQTAVLLAGLGLMLAVNYFGYWSGQPDADGNPTYLTVSWPWQIPFGSTIAFVWGYLLAGRRAAAAPA